MAERAHLLSQDIKLLVMVSENGFVNILNSGLCSQLKTIIGDENVTYELYKGFNDQMINEPDFVESLCKHIEIIDSELNKAKVDK